MYGNSDKETFPYQCLVEPEKLIGLNELWDMIYYLLDNNVANNVIKLVKEIYCHIDYDLNKEIRYQFLTKCFDNIDQL